MKNKPLKNSVLMVILAAVACLAVGIAAWLTGGFSEPPKIPSGIFEIPTFSVNGNKLTDESILNAEEALKIDVIGEFEAEVIRNPDIDFDFTLDGQLAGFSLIKDFSSAFGIVKHQDYFTINTTHRSMKEILSAIYPGQEIAGLPDNLTADPFVLRIISGEKSISIKLPGIGAIFIPVENIELDHTEIIF